MIKIRLDGSASPHIFRIPFQDDGLWRDAVELQPMPTVTSKQAVVLTYDWDKTPIEISYSIIDATVGERKINAIKKLKSDYVQEVNQLVHASIENDFTELSIKNAELVAKTAVIEAATTHEELDAIV